MSRAKCFLFFHVLEAAFFSEGEAGGLWEASFSLLMLDEHLFYLLANVPGENGYGHIRLKTFQNKLWLPGENNSKALLGSNVVQLSG